MNLEYESEADFRANVHSQLSELYGGEHVVQEYRLASNAFVDFAILDEDKDPFIFIESSISPKDKRDILQHLHDYIDFSLNQRDYSPPIYGGLITPEIEYVFERLVYEEVPIERTLGSMPRSPDSEASQREFKNTEEFQFCCDRANRVTGIKDATINLERLFVELHRKKIADENEITLPVGESGYESAIRQVNQISDIRDNSHSEGELPISRKVQGIFSGYNFIKTPKKVFQQYIENFASRTDELAQFTTPVSVAEELTTIAEIDSDSKVLDPAAGWGVVLREAASQGADCNGFDIDDGTVTIANSINSLVDEEIQISVGNSLYLPYDNGGEQDYSHVIIDPPLGKRLDDSDLPAELSCLSPSFIEDAMIVASLEFLRPGGLLTAVVPLEILNRNNSSDLRGWLLNEYQIKSIIEIKGGEFYPSMGDKVAIIQVINTSPNSDLTEFYRYRPHKTKLIETTREFESVESFDLSGEIGFLRDFAEQTLVPTELGGIAKKIESVYEEYDNISRLEEIAEEVRTGWPGNIDELENDGLPFIRISDRDEEEVPNRRVPESEATITANSADLLISKAGSIGRTYSPNEEIVPDDNWAILRFDSHEQAICYKAFFDSNIGQDLLQSISTGSNIRYTTISRLSRLPVPVFEGSELDEILEKLAIDEGLARREASNLLIDDEEVDQQ